MPFSLDSANVVGCLIGVFVRGVADAFFSTRNGARGGDRARAKDEFICEIFFRPLVFELANLVFALVFRG